MIWKSIISKLSDAESEAAETQVWIEFAFHCDYVARESALKLFRAYDEIICMLVAMISNPEMRTTATRSDTLARVSLSRVSMSPCLPASLSKEVQS